MTANEEIERLRKALSAASYALFQAKRLVDAGPITREHVRQAHDEACKVLDAEPPYVHGEAEQRQAENCKYQGRGKCPVCGSSRSPSESK